MKRKDYLHVRIEPELKKKVEDKAKEERISASQFVRNLLWSLFDAKE